MRRNDREITNRQEIYGVLKSCDVLRIRMNSPDFPYIIPMNFGTETEGQSLILWLHCAPEGLKLSLINKDNRVSFEADRLHKLISSDKACNFTMEYESVIGCGYAKICNDKADKRRGLQSIMRHYAPDKSFSFTDDELSAVCVLRINVMQITGKRLSSITKLT